MRSSGRPLATDPGREQAVGGAPRVPATRPGVCGLEGSPQKACADPRGYGALSGTYRVRGHQRNRGVTGSCHPRRQGAENERGLCSGEEHPLRQDRKDGPAGPTGQQPRLPAKGAAACPGPPVLGRNWHSRSEDRDVLPDEVQMGPADARPRGPPPHSSARRPGASAPLCARAPHPVRTRPSPAPGGCSVGPRGPVSRPEPATVTMCHRVSTWTPSRLVWGGTTGRGEGVRTLGIYAQAGDTPWLPVTAPCRGEGCLLPTRRPDPRPGRDSWGAPCPGHKGAPLHRGRDPWQAGWRPAGQV